MNSTLRTLLVKARSANMPADNIDRAIKKGTGELEGVNYEDVMLEGYGPGGVAFLVEGVSDNKNRVTSEVRTIFTKKNGNMAGAGSVAWMFEKKGYIVVKKSAIDEEKLMNIVLEAGAEDMETEDENYGIKTSPTDLYKVKTAIEAKQITIESAELDYIPKSTIKLASDDVKKVLDLVDGLEDHEDVQHVYANFDIPDDLLKDE